jgi:signal transduction histidine kinase
MIRNQECRVLTVYDLSKVNEVASLKAKAKSLELMSSTVSHEMLTPLKCIISIADRLKLSDIDEDI